MALLSQEDTEKLIKGQYQEVPVAAQAPAQQSDNSQGQAAVNSFTKGASFGLKNKLQGAEAATGAQVRKIAPQAVVNAADKAAGTSLDATVNPYMRAAQALPGVGPAISVFNMIVAAGTKSAKESWGDTYARLRDKGAQQDATNHKNFPLTTTAAEIAGSIPPTLLGGEAIQGVRGAVGLAKAAKGAEAASGAIKNIVGSTASGAAKGGATAGAYGVASEEGGSVGDKAKAGAVGAVFGAIIGAGAGAITSTKLLGGLSLLKKLTGNGDIPAEQAQAAIGALRKAGYDVKTVQDVQQVVQQAASQDGLTPEQAVQSVAKKVGAQLTQKDSSVASTAGSIASAIHPKVGEAVQAVANKLSPDVDSPVVSGLKGIVSSAPQDKTSSILGADGKPIVTPAPETPLPEAPDKSLAQKAVSAVENKGPSVIQNGAQGVSNQTSDANKDSPVDNEKTVDIDALLKSLNIDPNTPDGTQKKQSMSPTDHSDPTTQNRSEGQVSDDVPQITVVDGKQKLTTPSGQVVDLS